MEKLIITAAVTGSLPTKKRTPHVPITPAEIVERLNQEINAAFTDPKMKARRADTGGTLLAGSSINFAKLIGDETEKWGKVVKFSGAKPD